MKNQLLAKKGPLYDKLDTEFKQLKDINGNPTPKNINDYTHFPQLKLCYTAACGKGEFTMIDDAFLHKSGGKVDIIICDTKLSAAAPFTSNQQNNIDLKNNKQCTTKTGAVLSPPPVYSLKGKDDKAGTTNSNSTGIKELKDFKVSTTVTVSAVMKLECNGSANGVVNKIIKY
jgi:hypothetical protein